ncbi:transporter family-2 protein [Saccharopolyspora shandongensis]|uniref:Transporter family-2 protein n=1 Tax=Saccharopolyspora shandongensis TaxID=418495 RepID=A0A1H3PYH8_9PSEU|nr:DMT family transporter [Saccharopolyspora shandongensis]SDZ05469.1 transporter family-2 protein [Saccharopolyspora shandongensis]
MTVSALRHQEDRPKTRERMLGMAGAAGIGVLLAIQARINGALGVRMDDGIAAGLISFFGGFVVLLAATFAFPQARRGWQNLRTELRRPGGLRPWQCLGGVCGGYLVFTQGMAAAALGVAMFTVAVVAGQVSSGLVVDRLGLGPAGPQHVTPTRLFGAGLAVVAVVIAVSANLGSGEASWLVLLPALAGIGLGWQAAVNGRMKQAVDSAVFAAMFNFGIGMTALAVAFAVEVALRGLPHFPAEPWLYTGGFLGIFVIGGTVALVRFTGVLVLSLGMIAGQLVGALLVDVFAPAAETGIPASTVLGVLLTLVAVGVAALPDRPGRAGRRLPR